MVKNSKPNAATAATPSKINIGISEKDRAAIAGDLSHLLADTYTLYLTTHNFHWNVTGPMFNTLHAMFMAQYTEMWTAIDLVAERIRALGELAPQGYAAFGKLSGVKDGDPSQTAEAMLRENGIKLSAAKVADVALLREFVASVRGLKSQANQATRRDSVITVVAKDATAKALLTANRDKLSSMAGLAEIGFADARVVRTF